MGRLRGQLIPYQVFYAAGGGEVQTATDLDPFDSIAFDNLLKLLEIWGRRTDSNRASRVVDDMVAVFNVIRKAPFSKKDDGRVRQFLKTRDERTCLDAAVAFAQYSGKLSGKTHEHLSEVAETFLMSAEAWEAISCVADKFDGLRFDFEKSEDDVWYTDPPLKQLADLARDEKLDADDLIERLEAARDQVKHFQTFEDDDEPPSPRDQTLHLMTAHRAKGKEFDTVIMLDTGESIWPHKHAETAAELEAERRLFYVAFTRARKRVVMLMNEHTEISRFVLELGLPS